MADPRLSGPLNTKAPRAGGPADAGEVAEALHAGLAEPACAQRLRELGINRGTTDAAGFNAYWRSELERWAPIVAAARVTLD